MRLIDADAFREDYALGERCEDCRRFGKKECDYPAYSARDFCGWLDDAPTMELTDEAAIEHLKASGWKENHDDETVGPHWISVNDRLPEKHGRYLCWFGKNTFAVGASIVPYIPDLHWFASLESLERYENVTHWMPLPEPPKEDEA